MYPVRVDAIIFHDLRHCPCTAGNRLLARATLPDSDRVSLYCGFTAEGTGVSCMLGNLHLLHLFPEGGTVTERSSSVHSSVNLVDLEGGHEERRYRRIPSTVFTGNTDL